MRLDGCSLACLAIWACVVPSGCDHPPKSAGVAFFYGSAPEGSLSRYRRVVVDGHVLEATGRGALQAEDVQLFAYVSMGEADRSRPWYGELDRRWFLGTNPGWSTDIIDQRQPGWRRYLIERHVAALWALGFHGLFLDTLDSYELAIPDSEGRATQDNALRATIESLTEHYPGMELIFNRGFSLFSVPGCIGVAAESLFEGYDATAHRYRPVAAADRRWLEGHLREVRTSGRMAIAIDYVSPEDPALALRTAERINALDFVPWVTGWSLDRAGVGLADLGR